MNDKVVLDSWHKFVYYDECDKNKILDNVSLYQAKLDSDEPIVIYINDEGLPEINKNIEIDKYRVEFFHHRYYELLIFLSIIDNLINNIDKDALNSRLKRLFHLCSLSDEDKINDVIKLRNVLEKCKNTYKQEYINYIGTGVLRDFYDKLEIPNVIIDMVVPCIKKSIGLGKYFSLLIDVDSDLSLYNQMSINDYIASRCTGYLSINVLLSNNEWKYYYSSNRQFIQNVHDYSDIDLRRNNIKSRHI